MIKKNFFQRMKMPLPELEAYYRDRRAEAYERNIPFKGMKWRRGIHLLMLFGLRISRLLTGEKLHIINDRHTATRRPVIYACTHIGWHDIEMTFAAIKAHAYLFWGDPRELYRRTEGFLLYLNGAVACDTGSKKDRHIAKETSIRLLRQGGSLLIFPEGAWNVIDNQAVMPLYPGAAEMAIRTGAEIVPVAIEQYGNRYDVNIGKNLNFARYDPDRKQEATDQLRDALCTLKWEIWEKHGTGLRAGIPEDYHQYFLAKYEAQTKDVYTLENIRDTRYRPKVVEPEEAFSFMEHLIPCKENGFLFDKRNAGYQRFSIFPSC